MPKKKTCKAIAKRFKRTATGKIKRSMGGKSHLLTNKSRKQKRGLRGTTVVHASFAPAISVALGK